MSHWKNDELGPKFCITHSCLMVAIDPFDITIHVNDLEIVAADDA